MKKLLFISLFFLLASVAYSGETKKIIVDFMTGISGDIDLINSTIEKEGVITSELGGEISISNVIVPFDKPEPFAGFFFTVYLSDKSKSEIQINIDNTGWVLVNEDIHNAENNNIWCSSLYNFEKGEKNIKIKIISKTKITVEKVEFIFSNPQLNNINQEPLGNTIETEKSNLTGGSCTCAVPSYFTRAQWGCDNNGAQTCFPFISAAPVSHLIVHHEGAGSTTSSNWAARAYNIWNYHMNHPTENYCDVAYNWMLAPDGTLYEGRYGSGTSNVQGAHMCGNHENKLGVCIMGDWSSQTPPQACFNTLYELLAWKACEFDIDPFGSGPTTSYTGTMNNISGHRDGCAPGATTCPGNPIYNSLATIRNGVDSELDACSGIGGDDITVENYSVSPTSITCGGTVDVESDHVYSGSQLDVDLPTFNLDYYFSTDCNFDGNDVSLGNGETSGLGSDDPVNNETATLTIPTGITSGTYYILFVGDADDELVESNENNNISCVPITVTCSGGSGCPDPTITDLTTSPQNPLVGEDVDFDITIQNIGDGSTDANEDPHIVYTVNGVEVGDDIETTVLAPDASDTEVLTNYNFSAEGSYTICAILDPLTNECPTNNNSTCITITVDPCTTILSTNDMTIGSGMGGGGIVVNGSTNCPWTATENCDWITLTNTSGVSGDPFDFDFDQNTGLERSCIVTINGETLTITQEAAGTVGLNEIENNFSIFPNPSTGQFTLSLEVKKENNFEITVFNALGQSVYSENFSKVHGQVNKTINLNHLASAMYALQIRVGEETINRKIGLKK